MHDINVTGTFKIMQIKQWPRRLRLVKKASPAATLQSAIAARSIKKQDTQRQSKAKRQNKPEPFGNNNSGRWHRTPQ